ncbi:MAG: DUF2460 domain-containing protein, partial [Candidatus Thorarchaeota archaeon]
MAFHDVRLPDDVEKGSSGGPEFLTIIDPRATGFEKRNIQWSQARAKYDVGYAIQNKADFNAVRDFFFARFGRAHSFRFKDWGDFEMARQIIGQTDTSTTDFQIFKRYTSGALDYDRTIQKTVDGTVSVWVNNVAITEGAGGSQYTLDDLTGIVVLGATLAAQSGTDVEV